ncbi:hypothetical protein ACLD02_18365 [Alloalcanivorax sp. C16-2]|uniref:hypothetical protein n=1 Tax=Alloalcanivorax TaxID=3020832 RepID=UPI001931B823|nr:hypothetical protein [Alloalcanivorax marinus]MBL7252238.1 hypothetical protein [Alloalcanivorax marinus]
MRYCTVLLAALVALSGCDSSPLGKAAPGNSGARSTAVASGAPQARYENLDYGIALSYPKEEAERSKDRDDYFDEGGWRLGAGPDAPGAALLVLRLKGSDEIRAGELRLGASRDEAALATCTEPDPWARRGSVGEAHLDGVIFTTFQGGDAAMNHYRKVHAYRAVHRGVCYAIDLVVQGSNGQVYDPPREAPFSETRAFGDLQALVDGTRFIERAP